MNRPFVIVNCAMSVDGKITLPSRKQIKISSDEDIKRMYKLRNECDAVLVGINTVVSDNPKLTVKKEYVKDPKQPLRVVLDSKCRIPPVSLILDNLANTLILTKLGHEKNIGGKNIEVIGCKTDKDGNIDLYYALELLYKRNVKKLLVEGGATVIWNFLKNHLVDDLYVYTGPLIIGGKNTPTMADGEGINNENELISLKIIKISRLGDGFLTHYKMIK